MSIDYDIEYVRDMICDTVFATVVALDKFGRQPFKLAHVISVTFLQRQYFKIYMSSPVDRYESN